MVLCTAIYWCAEYWGIALGAEVLTVGIAVLCICFQCRDQEKRFFYSKGIIYSLYGLVVMILGYMFPLYTQGNVCYMLPLLVLYVAYISMAVKGHINEIYLRSLLGMVLYDTDKYNAQIK